MGKYRQLTQEQRYQIFAYLEVGFKNSEIAKKIGKNRSTIGRERMRNSINGKYKPEKAEKLANIRRRESHRPAKKINEELSEVIVSKLEKDWSPEEISGRTKRSGEKMVCATTIYNFVYDDAKLGGQLHKKLRRKHYKRTKRKSFETRGKINNAKSIDNRPKEVLTNANFGHWEGDTIIGKNHKNAIVVLVERKTKIVLAKKVAVKTAIETEQAIVSLLSAFSPISHTLTVDNGKEFANHESISSTLGIDMYFSHKGCPGERGLCENTNSLIRQYLPKGSSFENVTDWEIQEIVAKLNTRPRKILGFASPAEALDGIMIR